MFRRNNDHELDNDLVVDPDVVAALESCTLARFAVVIAACVVVTPLLVSTFLDVTAWWHCALAGTFSTIPAAWYMFAQAREQLPEMLERDDEVDQYAYVITHLFYHVGGTIFFGFVLSTLMYLLWSTYLTMLGPYLL